MKEMGWSYQQLMDTPYEEYLNYRRIMSLENKEEIKQKKKQERQAKRNT